ncbi:unnamed protein product [Penicillium pancosmium]
MAKLMDVESPTSQPPGSALFTEALSRLPQLHHLGGEGVIAVEILTLMATYLQWCDRKHDAYVHSEIGLALRLAIALGCNLPESLAAGADERQLRAGFPRHVAGFQSPVALNINVRIARITDEIMSCMLQTASFGLYANIVRLRVQRQQKLEDSEIVPDMLSRLCDTCNEAATRSLAILHSLQRQRTIPRFGFFDLDATFSAAFVLVMGGFINSSQDEPPPALSQAYEVLQFLARSGNFAAEQRLQDISQSCSHVWPSHIFNKASSSEGSPQVSMISRTGGLNLTQDESGDRRHFGNYPIQPRSSMSFGSGSRHNHHDESQWLEPWANLLSTDTVFGTRDDWNIDLSGEAEDIYSSFNNPTLPLTGVDYMDWLEIEKVLKGPETLPT